MTDKKRKRNEKYFKNIPKLSASRDLLPLGTSETN
jgi:hypothetical protein